MYNYFDEMYNDIKNAIINSYFDTIRAAVADADAVTADEVAKAIPEAFWDLNDLLWVDDSVTGNASGSYFFNAWKAEEALTHNWELVSEAAREFGETGGDWFERGPEYCDVRVRCYLLGGILSDVLDEIAESVRALAAGEEPGIDAAELVQFVA